MICAYEEEEEEEEEERGIHTRCCDQVLFIACIEHTLRYAFCKVPFERVSNVIFGALETKLSAHIISNTSLETQ